MRIGRALTVNICLVAHSTAVIELRFRIQLHLFGATIFVWTLVHNCFNPVAQLSFIAMVCVQSCFVFPFFTFIYFAHEIIVESFCVSRAKDPCIYCCVLAELVESQLVMLLLVFRYAVATLLPSLQTLAA